MSGVSRKRHRKGSESFKKVTTSLYMLFEFFEEAISTKADGRIHGGATVKTCQNHGTPGSSVTCFTTCFRNSTTDGTMTRCLECVLSPKKMCLWKTHEETPTVDLKCHQHVEMYVDLQTFPIRVQPLSPSQWVTTDLWPLSEHIENQRIVTKPTKNKHLRNDSLFETCDFSIHCWLEAAFLDVLCYHERPHCTFYQLFLRIFPVEQC